MDATRAKRRRLLLKTLGPGVAAVLVAVAVLAWTRLRGGDDYVPGEDVEGITATLTREVPEGFSPVAFTEVSAEVGLRFLQFSGTRSVQLPEDMGSGVAWGDMDGDGDPDLYAVAVAGPLPDRDGWPASPASSRLFRNDGGRFTDVTDAAGVGARDMGMAAAWADVDGDRDLDLAVSAYGSLRLYRNRGDGTFDEVTAAAGLERDGYFSGLTFGDVDRDGDLDLYVCGYVRYEFRSEDRARTSSQYQQVIPATLNPSTYPPHENVLLRNDGTGRFEDVTAHAGVANAEGRSLGAVLCDFDEDGWIDLYVANDISDNVMYRNRGDGTFEDVSHAAWVADYRGAMGLAVADFDADLDLDLFVTHWIAQENALYANLLAERRLAGAAPAGGFCNFQDDADRLGLGQIALDYVGWGTFFFDLDLDARLDLFVANGSTFQRDGAGGPRLIPMRQQLFWNGGPDRGFFEVGALCGPYFEQEHVGRGAACADYDGDGDVDFAVVHHDGGLALLRNELGRDRGGELRRDRHWLGVRLRGSGGNTFGVGAKVTVTAAGTTQSQVVGAAPSYLSQSDLTVHFGLGPDAAAERVEIRWPGGARQALERVEGDRIAVIEEPR